MSLDLIFDIVLAYLLDLIIGDPYWLPHPVRAIGWLIIRLEQFLRSLIEIYCNKIGNVNIVKIERLAGFILTTFVVFVTFIIVFSILKIAASISMVLFHIINVYFIYSSMAVKCLADEAMKIYIMLKNENMLAAKKQLVMLLNRDTKDLSKKEIMLGVIECISENTVDGVISPLFYAIVGSFWGISAPLAYAFKAASTLDSMVGHMNEKYINFGKFSAKIDDVTNYIPARLSGILIPLSSFFCGMGFLKSFSIMIRDRKNHKSPNSAYPEAAVAGALGIRLGGPYPHFGKIVKKQTIGELVKEVELSDIRKAIKLMHIATFLFLIFSLGILVFYNTI